MDFDKYNFFEKENIWFYIFVNKNNYKVIKFVRVV